jgi:hypothetical protein
MKPVPVPIIIILYIFQMAYNESRDVAALAIVDMICIAFFFLLRPGEFMAPPRLAHPFASRMVASTFKTASWTCLSARTPSWM